MTSSYLVPKNAPEVCYEIKKSRFIARLVEARDREQALAYLDQAKQDYPDARHHCWAYLIGPPSSPLTLAMSDDGEPSGTAGKPILNVLQHKMVGNVMLIVIRYFGGIKLGAGGLVRAYSQAAQMAYEQLETDLFSEKIPYQIQCDFAEEQTIRHWLQQHQATIVQVNYTEQVALNIQLAKDHLNTLELFLDSLNTRTN